MIDPGFIHSLIRFNIILDSLVNSKPTTELFVCETLKRICICLYLSSTKTYHRLMLFIFLAHFPGTWQARALQWRHSGHDSVLNHQPHDCLLNRLFKRRSTKTSKLRVTGLCTGNSPGPVNSPHKWPVTRKMFPFDDVIMRCSSSGSGCLDVEMTFYQYMNSH